MQKDFTRLIELFEDQLLMFFGNTDTRIFDNNLDFGRVGPGASAGQYRAFPVKGAVTEGAFLGGSAETFMGDGELRFVFCAHVEKAVLRFLRDKAPLERDVTAEVNAVLPASFRQTSAYIEGEHARRRKALEKLSAAPDEKAP